MLTVGLLGKKYEDYLLTSKSLLEGETNICDCFKNRLGGIYNFLRVPVKNVNFKIYDRGKRKAFIINDVSSSKRTSFTFLEEKSSLSLSSVESINKTCDWLHVAYIDDIEDYREILNINIPISLDFCTNSPRESFIDIMEKSEIIFDSRERKNLYNNIHLNNSTILHDDKGIEILEKSKKIHSSKIKKLKNLEVNGAGDSYAAFLIEDLQYSDIIKASNLAMHKTTSFLKLKK